MGEGVWAADMETTHNRQETIRNSRRIYIMVHVVSDIMVNKLRVHTDVHISKSLRLGSHKAKTGEIKAMFRCHMQTRCRATKAGVVVPTAPSHDSVRAR